MSIQDALHSLSWPELAGIVGVGVSILIVSFSHIKHPMFLRKEGVTPGPDKPKFKYGQDGYNDSDYFRVGPWHRLG